MDEDCRLPDRGRVMRFELCPCENPEQNIPRGDKRQEYLQQPYGGSTWHINLSNGKPFLDSSL